MSLLSSRSPTSPSRLSYASLPSPQSLINAPFNDMWDRRDSIPEDAITDEIPLNERDGSGNLDGKRESTSEGLLASGEASMPDQKPQPLRQHSWKLTNTASSGSLKASSPPRTSSNQLFEKRLQRKDSSLENIQIPHRLRIQHMDSAMLLKGLPESPTNDPSRTAPPLPTSSLSSLPPRKLQRQSTYLSDFHRNRYSIKKRKKRRKENNNQSPPKKRRDSQDDTDDAIITPLWKHILQNNELRDFVMQNSQDLKEHVAQLESKRQEQEDIANKLSLGVALKLSHWFARSKINAKKARYAEIREQLQYAIKKQNLVTHYDEEADAAVQNDKRRQVNVDMYSDENMFKRDDNRRSKRLIFFTWHWWLDMKKRASNSCVAKRTYIQMLHVIYELLCPMMPRTEYEAEAERDWNHDAQDKEDISWELFRNSVFELCDLWTDSAEESEYVEFVRSMHTKLVEHARAHDLQFIAHETSDETYIPEEHENPWTRDEDEDLERLVNQFMDKRRQVLWAHLARAKKKGTQRTYVECEVRFKKLKSRWKEEEECQLMRLVDQYNLRHGNTNAAMRPDERVFRDIVPHFSYGMEQLRRKYTELGSYWDPLEEEKYDKILVREKYELWRNRNKSNSKLKKLLVDQLNWKLIASHLSRKDAFHCRQRYLEHYAYQAPKRRPWSLPEDALLISLCQDQSNVNDIDWNYVAEHIDLRFPQECEERFKEQCMNWSAENDARLIHLAQQHKMSHKGDPNSPHPEGVGMLRASEWERISKQFPDKSPPACEFRYYYKSGDWKIEDDVTLFQQVLLLGFDENAWPKIAISLASKSTHDCKNRFYFKMKNWKRQEDKILTESVQQHISEEASFSSISTLLPGHSPEECHARHIYLKQAWSAEEDQLLRKSVQEHGTKAWERIAQSFERRIAADCRARYRLLVEWQPNEDAALERAVDIYGEEDCASVSKHLPLKSKRECRKRYMLLVARRGAGIVSKSVDMGESNYRSQTPVIPQLVQKTDAVNSAKEQLTSVFDSTQQESTQSDTIQLSSAVTYMASGVIFSSGANNFVQSEMVGDAELYRRYIEWKGQQRTHFKRQSSAKIVLPTGGQIVKSQHDGIIQHQQRSYSLVSETKSPRVPLQRKQGASPTRRTAQSKRIKQGSANGDMKKHRDHDDATGLASADWTPADSSDMRSLKSSARGIAADPLTISNWRSVYVLDNNPQEYTWRTSDPVRRERFESMIKRGKQYHVHRQYLTYYNEHSELGSLQAWRDQNVSRTTTSKRPMSPDQWSRGLSRSVDLSMGFSRGMDRLDVLSPPQQNNLSRSSSPLKTRSSLPQKVALTLEERFEKSRKDIAEKLMKLRMTRMQMKREAKEEKRKKKSASTEDKSLFPSIKVG